MIIIFDSNYNYKLHNNSAENINIIECLLKVVLVIAKNAGEFYRIFAKLSYIYVVGLTSFTLKFAALFPSLTCFSEQTASFRKILSRYVKPLVG